MNQTQFLGAYTYALEQDFVSSSGAPASWEEGYPKVWGQEKAKIRLDGTSITTPTLSPDDEIVAIGVDSDVHVFRVATQERVAILQEHGELVTKVHFSTMIYKANDSDKEYYLLVSSSEDENCVVWEIQKYPDDIESSLVPKKVLHFKGGLPHYGPAFSPNGKHLIYLTQNETTQSDDSDDDTEKDPLTLPSVNIWNIETKSHRQFHGHTDSILWAGISPDNLMIASASLDGTARIWDIKTGSCLHTFGPYGGQLWTGAFSPDGKYFAFNQGNPQCQVHVYEIETETLVSSKTFHLFARSIAWNHDGSLIACGANKGKLLVWDPYTGREHMRWRMKFALPYMEMILHIAGLKFLGDDRLIFQLNEGTVEVYDFRTNSKKQFTRGPDDKIERFPRVEKACSENVLVVPDKDGFLRFWDL